MSRKILQDVIVSKTHKRKKVDVNFNTAKKNDVVSIENEREFDKIAIMNTEIKNAPLDDLSYSHSQRGSARFIMWAIAIFALSLLLFVLLSFFSTTVVRIVPLSKDLVINGQFVATKDTEKEALPFKLVIQEHSVSNKIPATGEEKVQRKASGTIIIYNAYSTEPEKLIKRTRFESTNGYEYRISDQVIVPGMKKVNGEIIPGSIEAVVQANFPGEEYNIDLSDFSVPGLKGYAQAGKIYARSKTPMTGGFSGNIKVAREEDIEKIKTELTNSLKDVLITQARAEVPNDFVLYDDAIFFNFGSPEVSDTEDINSGTVSVSTKGTLYGILFNKKDLSKEIAKNTIASYGGDSVYMNDLDKLKFSVTNKESFDPVNDVEINFTLSGEGRLIWNVDSLSLASDLAGQNKKSFINIRDRYSGIQRFEAVVRPFWKKTFPDDPKDITIKILKENPQP